MWVSGRARLCASLLAHVQCSLPLSLCEGALSDVALRSLPGDSWKRAARGNYLTSVWIKAENVTSLPRGLVQLHSSNNGDGILSSCAFQLAAAGWSRPDRGMKCVLPHGQGCGSRSAGLGEQQEPPEAPPLPLRWQWARQVLHPTAPAVWEELLQQ